MSDTISGQFGVIGSHTNSTNVRLANCFFDGPIDLFIHTGASKLTFDKCVFGSKARLSTLKVDTIIFKGCTDIKSPLNFSADD